MSDEGPDDFAFGDGGFAKLYGDRLADSSLLECAVATRWLFLYMLARADAEGRFRCATVEGLARAAAVTLAEAEQAVAELEAPDPHSTTPDEDGRRVVRILGGWRIVTKKKYREYQTKRQREDAEKKRRQREAAEQRRAAEAEELARLRAVVGLERGGHVQGRPGDIPATPAPEAIGQRPEANVNGSSGADAPGSAPPRVVKVEATKTATAEPSWSKQACDDWNGRFEGTAPGGRIGKALAPLVKVHGWEVVREAWRSYLAQAEAEFVSAQRFAATYGRWSGTVPAAPPKLGVRQDPAERTMEAARRFVASKRVQP